VRDLSLVKQLDGVWGAGRGKEIVLRHLNLKQKREGMIGYAEPRGRGEGETKGVPINVPHQYGGFRRQRSK